MNASPGWPGGSGSEAHTVLAGATVSLAGSGAPWTESRKLDQGVVWQISRDEGGV